jgi:hypothetical protein
MWSKHDGWQNLGCLICKPCARTCSGGRTKFNLANSLDTATEFGVFANKSWIRHRTVGRWLRSIAGRDGGHQARGNTDGGELNWLLLLLLLCRGCKSSRPGDDAAGMNGAGRMVVGLMAASSSSDPRRPGWPAGVVVLHRPLIGERDGMQCRGRRVGHS